MYKIVLHKFKLEIIEPKRRNGIELMGRERIDSVRVRLFEYGNHVVTVYLIKYDCIYYFIIIKTVKSLFI